LTPPLVDTLIPTRISTWNWIDMPFIIVADHRSQEIERRELSGPIVIGRSPECDVPIRDILLSRRHCAMERIGDAWVIADLGSKNGTRVNGELINRHILHDADVIRIGRSRLAFREGLFVPAPPDVKHARQRPSDPLEAMSGTLSGFRFNEDEEEKLDQRVLDTFPRPKPRPNEPRAYQNEQLYTMIADIASSAWDSMLTEPEHRDRKAPLPQPKVEKDDLPLQVTPELKEPSPVLTEKKRIDWKVITQDVVAVLYILLTLIVTGTGVWVISRGW
jgi:pSer/pThr/pTyr-binding forkhead associated (FHA) protein